MLEYIGKSTATDTAADTVALFEVVLGIALVGYGYQRACIEGLLVENWKINIISVLRHRYGSSY